MTTQPAGSSYKSAFAIRWFFCAIVTCFMVAMITLASHQGSLPPREDGGFWSHAFESLFFLVTLTVVTPLMVLAVIGMQPFNAASGQYWTRPTFHENPLKNLKPMQIHHVLAQLFVVMGTGVLVSTLWNGVHVMPIGIMALWFGVMQLVGLRLCEKVYHKRMVKPD